MSDYCRICGHETPRCYCRDCDEGTVSDQPKPMSVESARKEIEEHDTSSPRSMQTDLDNLIAAVRAETFAEFRKLAEKYHRIEDTLRTGEIHPEACNVIKNIMSDMSRLIQSLETPNQKP